jgi:predicted GNAT family acetyltransferase
MKNEPSAHDDEKLDEALEETFPASDPPSNTVETGIRTPELPDLSAVHVSDNAAVNRFELTVGGETAFLTYKREHGALTLLHTEVPPDLRGQHLGGALVEAALKAAHAEGLLLVVQCPFAREYIRKHPR